MFVQLYKKGCQSTLCQICRLPKSAKLSREPWGAGFRESVSNMKLHLGWDQVLVGQQLQLPHPTSLHQLEGDVLRIGA